MVQLTAASQKHFSHTGSGSCTQREGPTSFWEGGIPLGTPQKSEEPWHMPQAQASRKALKMY